MINWLQKNYHLKQESTSSQKLELEKLRQQVQEYRKKYNEGDKEMEVSSESDSEVDEEEQRRIDEEMKKKKKDNKKKKECVQV